MVTRVLVLVYAVLVYLAFLGAFLYLIAFVGDYGAPHGIDRGPRSIWYAAVSIDLSLLLAFAAQHTVMARPRFKKWLARSLPEAAERATFVLAATLALLLMVLCWHPIDTIVWDERGTWLGGALTAASIVGWGVTLVSTFQLDHFELFGLRQAWDNLRGASPGSPHMRVPTLYRYVRHPMYTGLFLAFWSCPTMSVGHALFAAGMTAYVLVGVRCEERELVREFGDDYRDYQRRVPMLVPWRWPTARLPTSGPSDRVGGRLDS